VIYQGQLSPGRDMGEIMMKQEWAPRPLDSQNEKLDRLR
jgi:hypothetical protein